jgi:hypothetical protein
VTNLKFLIKHRIKLMLLVVLRFVVARPKLLAAGLFFGKRIPPLKRFLTRMHMASVAPAPQQVEWIAPASVPEPARSVYLQLTIGRKEN